jgi:endo-1,4-beta-xylanase
MPSSSRPRLAAVIALLFGVFATISVLVIHPASAASTLDQLAKAHGKYFGSATDNSELSDSAYTAILGGGEFGSTTPGNSMKWDTTEPSRGSFNFGGGDQIVSFAKSHNMIVRGHNLVWHSQLPSWVNSLPGNQVQAAMENHITTEVTHYRGQLYAWDVVNEPFDDNGNLRADAFYTAMGSGYIADALRTARAADPNAKLYLNDYNIEGAGAKADAMYNLVKSLKSQGAPIDGVGFESHLATQYGFPTNMQQNMQRFADLGVDVAITELDVRMPLPETSAQDATQVTYYSNVVKACMAITRCVGITIWDFTDKYSWVPSAFSGQGAACPWDSNLNKKASVYGAISTALGGDGGGGQTPPPPPPGGCTVVYSVNGWNTGFTANITITNQGSATNGWTLKYSYAGDQKLTQGWSGTWSQSGKDVTVTNASWNGTLATGASTSVGGNFTYTGTNTAPAAFTLNGTTCG